MGLFDPELNDWKILWNEAMTGFGHTGGLADTLNRMASRIYNLIRQQVIHADGTNKIRAFNKKIAEAGSVAPQGVLGELGFFEFTITDNKAVITGSTLFNTGLEAVQGDAANIVVEYEIDGSSFYVNDNELFYSVNGKVKERTVAAAFSADVTGAGLHTVSFLWNSSGGNDKVNTESGVFMHGFVLENQELIQG